MTYDSLSRRLRSAPPNPKVRRLVLTPSDHLLFEAIDRHGPLPTHYLFEFVRHLRRDYTYFQHRLTEFYNGDRRGPYLDRPRHRPERSPPDGQHEVHDLTSRARIALAERGTLERYSPPRTDPFPHRLMGACVAASIELAAVRGGIRYISREEILAHPNCPEETRQSFNPLAIPLAGGRAGSRLIPDDLFGFEYPGVGFRFFAVEVDRNTESIQRQNHRQTAFGRKVAGYFEVLRDRAYRGHWGIPNLSVLTVTTNRTHACNLVDCVESVVEPGYSDRFAFACEPCFGADCRVPRDLLSHLFDAPWITSSGTKAIGKPQ